MSNHGLLGRAAVLLFEEGSQRSARTPAQSGPWGGIAASGLWDMCRQYCMGLHGKG